MQKNAKKDQKCYKIAKSAAKASCVFIDSIYLSKLKGLNISI